MHLVWALCSNIVCLDQVPGNAIIFKGNNVLRISWRGAFEVNTILNMRSKLHPKEKPILNSCSTNVDHLLQLLGGDPTNQGGGLEPGVLESVLVLLMRRDTISSMTGGPHPSSSSTPLCSRFFWIDLRMWESRGITAPFIMSTAPSRKARVRDLFDEGWKRSIVRLLACIT